MTNKEEQTMRVTIRAPFVPARALDVRDFDPFGHSPDHLAVIAPAYLRPLTLGAEYVDVIYSSPTVGEFTERHRPAGWRDGAVVGTSVEYV